MERWDRGEFSEEDVPLKFSTGWRKDETLPPTQADRIEGRRRELKRIAMGIELAVDPLAESSSDEGSSEEIGEEWKEQARLKIGSAKTERERRMIPQILKKDVKRMANELLATVMEGSQQSGWEIEEVDQEAKSVKRRALAAREVRKDGPAGSQTTSNLHPNSTSSALSSTNPSTAIDRPPLAQTSSSHRAITATDEPRATIAPSHLPTNPIPSTPSSHLSPPRRSMAVPPSSRARPFDIQAQGANKPEFDRSSDFYDFGTDDSDVENMEEDEDDGVQISKVEEDVSSEILSFPPLPSDDVDGEATSEITSSLTTNGLPQTSLVHPSSSLNISSFTSHVLSSNPVVVAPPPSLAPPAPAQPAVTITTTTTTSSSFRPTKKRGRTRHISYDDFDSMIEVIVDESVDRLSTLR